LLSLEASRSDRLARFQITAVIAASEDLVSFVNKFSRKAPSQADFARLVIQAFESAGLPGLDYREEEFALKVPGREATVFLHNSYSNYCQVPQEQRQEVLAMLVASFAAMPEIPKDFALAKPHLMPVVRDGAYESLSQLRSAKDGAKDTGLEWQTRPLAGGLIVGLAYDSQHSITTLSRGTLDEWRVDFDEAFAAAKDNLWERTDPAHIAGETGVFWGTWGDSYDSSRMLFPELIYRLALDGDPVASVPNRDSLLLTGKNNEAGLRAILKTGGETHFTQGHPVSPDLYVLDEGVWKLYQPEDLELRELWMSTKRRRDALDYSQQKEILDKLPAYEDVFVANCNLLTRHDGIAFSVCVWPKGTEALLPRAEAIGFVLDLESQENLIVIWDAAIPIIGDLLEQEKGLTPVRYRVRRFPNPAQITQLRRVARNPR
jgi:uncharacterized protein YtpQ (UPF0354 family)